jgi:hypothetical protein
LIEEVLYFPIILKRDERTAMAIKAVKENKNENPGVCEAEQPSS